MVQRSRSHNPIELSGGLSMQNDIYATYIIRQLKIGTSNLNIYKLLFKLSSLLLFISLSIFYSPNRYIWKNIKVCALENSWLNRWFSLVYFKVVVLGYSRPKSSKLQILYSRLLWCSNDVKYQWKNLVFSGVAGCIFPFSVRSLKHFKMSDRGVFVASEKFLSATFTLRILKEYLWKKRFLEGS